MLIRISAIGLFAMAIIASACTAPAPGSDVDAPPAEDASDTPADATQADATPDAPLADASTDAPLDAFACTANEFLRCDGDNAIFCNATGDAEASQSCGGFGCNATAGRCNDVDPSNGLAVYLDMAASQPSFIIPDGSTINTNDGSVTDNNGDALDIPNALVAAPENGVAIRVFMAQSLSIGRTTITGTPAIALVSDGDVIISGTVDVDAGTFEGPSCVRVRAGICAIGIDCPGKGGAGFGGPGGDGGGVADAPGAGEEGGATYGTESLIPLIGGCDFAPSGGAIQIVSRTEIRLVDQGGLDLGGSGGGFGGHAGSGGAALLEAPAIIIAADSGIAANGGGGAGGCDNDGVDAGLSSQPASGGKCSSDDGDGGDGAALGVPAQIGETPTIAGNHGGSGGGGVGRIRVNVLGGGYQPAVGAIISPTPSLGDLQLR